MVVMRRSMVFRGVTTCLVGFLAACGSQAAVTHGTVARGAVASQSAAPPTDGPQINWDDPLGAGGLTVSPDQASAKGHLPFAVIDPAFKDATVGRVAVTRPDSGKVQEGGGAAFVYRFPSPSTDFPTDGRVEVVEMKATAGRESDFATIAAGHVTDGHYTLVTVRGHPALLISDRGIGRILFVVNGVELDITGPATAPLIVEKLAAAIPQ